MRIVIAAVGKAGRGPEAALYGEYIRRLPWQVSLKEIEIKQNLSGAARKAREGEALLAACKDVDRIVALDEHGKDMGSRALASTLDGWRQAGETVAFVLGGADGLDEALLARADLKLAFGRATWPHLLARAMLAEQLYRAYTLMTRHPYHRA